MTCNGCGARVAPQETTVHDQTCKHHGGRVGDGWSKCTHEGRCYREEATDVR